MSHAANPDLLNRLRRANGHLAGIIRMVEEGEDGLKIGAADAGRRRGTG